MNGSTAELRIPQLDDIQEMLAQALAQRPTQKWFTGAQAYAAKFGSPETGPAMSTYKKNPGLQPAGGIPDGWLHGIKMWRRETIDRWMAVNDDSLEAYLAEVAPSVRVPQFVKESIRKRREAEVLLNPARNEGLPA
jgi:hypothetical protein